VNTEQINIWKETILTYVKALNEYSSGDIGKTTKSILVTLTGIHSSKWHGKSTAVYTFTLFMECDYRRGLDW
jgi:hypothetical protein